MFFFLPGGAFSSHFALRQIVILIMFMCSSFSIKGAVEPESKLGNSAIDLPMYTKYLLIAAYLASFNSPKYDKRLYLKGSDKAKKRAAIKHSAEKSVKQCLGPKAFSLNRLLAIFYAICDEPVNLTVNIYSQVGTEFIFYFF